MASLGLRARQALTCVALTAFVSGAIAAPGIQQVTGSFDHKGTINITGSGFGSKGTAAPLVWDDASGSNILDKWDGAWPDQLDSFNAAYHSPMRGIDPPHSHDARYIAGAHASNKSGEAGYLVVVFKDFDLQPFPFNVYASWYQRADNQWFFGGDNNFKTFNYSNCCEPMAAPNDWFTAYGPPHPGNTKEGAQWVLTDNGPSLNNPDARGHNMWWGQAANPMAGKWIKVEIAIKATNQNDGYINVWENGHQVVAYVGPTDRYPGNRRTVGIGGYARMQGHSTNWRYYDDVYVDTSLARVVLADSPVLSRATIIENQIPSAWSDGSITATVNLGQFTQGQTAYLFVVDSNGSASASGTPVTAGGMAQLPNPPSGVSVH